MSQACARWRGDIGAYVVGALSPVEAAPVQWHLRNCAACRADYLDLIPVPHWLSRMNPADGMPPRQPPDGPPANPARPRRRAAPRRLAWQRAARRRVAPRRFAWQRVAPRRWFARRRLAAAGAVAAAAAIAVITTLSAHHPAGPGLHAFDPGTGVGGQATLRSTPTGTQISLTLTGLPAGQHCILVTVSRAGTAVAGTWTAEYDGTAEITGVTAIPLGRLIALRVDAPPGRLLLNIPL